MIENDICLLLYSNGDINERLIVELYAGKSRNTIERELFDLCFEDCGLLDRLCRFFGWQGGTIHQVIDQIAKL